MTRIRSALIALALAALAAPPALGLDAHAVGSLDVAGPVADPPRNDAGPLPAAPRGAEAPAAFDEGSAAAAGDYDIRFRCPDGAVNPPEAQNVDATCPVYVKDPEDIFGQPVLVIDPIDPRKMAFSAIHGGQNPTLLNTPPPSERSRHDPVHQPHTTFMSRDEGATWKDLPYYAPDGLQRREGELQRSIWGEDNAAVLDQDGRIYVAALYAYVDTERPNPFSEPPSLESQPPDYRYVVAVWKGKGLERDMEYFNGQVFLNTSPQEDDTWKADSLHMAFVPATRQVVVMVRESAPVGGGNETLGSEIVLHSSPADGNSIWTTHRTGIGPCDAVSSPLAMGDRLFVGCFPPEGGNATGMQVWSVETANWTATSAGVAPLSVRQAILVAREQGEHMVAIGAGVVGGAARVELSYGEAGAGWGEAADVASSLAYADVTGRPEPGELLEARVTAAAFAPVSGNVHFVYLQRFRVADDAQTPGIHKVFAAVQAGGSFQGYEQVELGLVSRGLFPSGLTPGGEGLFNDLHDAIVVWRDPVHGNDREFLAIGDYGFVQFAEVVEENPLPPIILPLASVPPVPVAVAGSIPAVVGLGAGVLSAAAVARAMSNKKKSAVGAGME